MNSNLFKGFDEDTFFLLAENRFNDSKVHYDSVKELLNEKATVPMRNLCSDLCQQLFEIDEHMNLVPTKMVSRIRRDTRRSKNKEMYRENMWCMFMRHKKEWNHQPCMWFEFTPQGYSIGIGLYYPLPSYFEAYRKVILENPDEFKQAVLSAESVGALPSFETYNKVKPGTEFLPDELKSYYNARDLYFIKYSTDMNPLFDGSIIYEISRCIDAFAPLYKFLIKVMEKIIAEKGNNYD